MVQKRSRVVTSLVAGALVVLPTVFATDAVGAEKDRILVRDGRVAQIGKYDVSTGLAGAKKAFGKPSKSALADESGQACVVRWNDLGLRIHFVNLGGGDRDACTPGVGKAQTFDLTKPTLRTWRGARVGMPIRELRQRHKDARKINGGGTGVFGKGWALRMGRVEGYRAAIVLAKQRNGKVSALSGYMGLAGP